MASRDIVGPYFEDVWQAFNELHRVRQVGFGINAITYSDICAWLDIHSIYDNDDRKFYYEVIINVDSEFVTWARDREEKKRQKPKSGK